MKRETRGQLNKKIQIVFNKYIRLRDCLEYQKKHGGLLGCNCISCDTWYMFESLNAGHWISVGSSSALRFDERNVSAQCLTGESSLRLFTGRNKSIADIKVGDELWGFNEKTYLPERATVSKVGSFKPEVLYEVVLEDSSIFYATPDHRVVSNGGWVYIEDILHDVSAHDILEL